MNAIRALLFDVFGTVVDWRGSLVREGRTLAAHKGLEVDWDTCALLDTSPEETLMVAAHEDDLAARALGLRTAFVRRPKEFGRPSGYNLPRDSSFDLVADDFAHLADQLSA